MKDFILLMHNDATGKSDDWPGYFEKLRKAGRFQGGSSIGPGLCLRKTGKARPLNDSLSGYIRVQARDLQDAQSLVPGNPVYEAGGTIEIRELPRDD